MLTQSFLLGAVYQSYLYYLPLYFQNVRVYTAIESAAIQSSLVINQSIASIIAGQYISRYGEVLWGGFGLWTFVLAIVGVGVGYVFQPTLSHYKRTRRSHADRSSSLAAISCAVPEGAFGLAISAGVLQVTLRNNLHSEYKYLASSTYSLPQLTGPGQDTVLDAYKSASRNTFIIQAPMMGLCLLGCLLIKDKGLEPSNERVAREAAASAIAMENMEQITPEEKMNTLRQSMLYKAT